MTHRPRAAALVAAVAAPLATSQASGAADAGEAFRTGMARGPRGTPVHIV